jgi:Flp pilus assembly pilin Flp
MRTFVNAEEGATAPEYAIMVGLITAVIVGAVGAIGNALIPIFTTAAGWFTGS